MSIFNAVGPVYKNKTKVSVKEVKPVESIPEIVNAVVDVEAKPSKKTSKKNSKKSEQKDY